jgi:hypothetical protein
LYVFAVELHRKLEPPFGETHAVRRFPAAEYVFFDDATVLPEFTVTLEQSLLVTVLAGPHDPVGLYTFVVTMVGLVAPKSYWLITNGLPYLSNVVEVHEA